MLAWDVFRILLTVIVGFIIYWIIQRRKKMTILQKLGIPVVPNVSYWSGNLIKVPKDTSYLEMESEWINTYGKKVGRYGKILGFYVGPHACVYVSDPDILKEVLIKQFSKFVNRPYLIDDGRKARMPDLLQLRDTNWKRVRTILTPTFSSAKMKLMSHIANHHMKSFMDVVTETAAKGEDCDLHSVYQELTLHVIGEIVLAMKTDCSGGQADDPLLDLCRLVMNDEKNVAALLALLFPEFSSLFIFMQDHTRRAENVRQIMAWVQKLIGERRADMESAPRDLLQLMMEAQTDIKTSAGMTSVEDTKLKDTEIVSNAFLFLLAGYETTSTALAYTTYLLAEHWEIQEKCYEEIIEVVKDEGVSYDDAMNLSYMDQVVNEALRMYPPVPIHYGRTCNESCEINGVKFLKGTRVLVPVWHLHHDPEIWNDPDTFDPERWSPENKKNIPSMAHLPFGDGPRKCIGLRFAMMEIKMALANLILTYHVKLSDRAPRPLKVKSSGFGIQPQHGKLWFTLQKRATKME